MTLAAQRVPEGLDEEPTIDIPGVTRPMTYEEYLNSPEEMARYDIIDGYKEYRLYGPEGNQLPNPIRLHQRIQLNLGILFDRFEKTEGLGRVVMPPCDVLIGRTPRLRSRQPDVLFISGERFRANAQPDGAAPLDPAPELAVEILSPSDHPSVLAAKIADYASVNVRELWLARSSARTVEVMRLSTSGVVSTMAYGAGETITSLTFPGLTVAVDTVFAD